MLPNKLLNMDTTSRSIVKTILFKLITTSITALYMGNIGKAVALHVILTVVYLVYERGWNRISWGRIV